MYKFGHPSGVKKRGEDGNIDFESIDNRELV
jgi:hypothetical protein